MLIFPVVKFSIIKTNGAMIMRINYYVAVYILHRVRVSYCSAKIMKIKFLTIYYVNLFVVNPKKILFVCKFSIKLNTYFNIFIKLFINIEL